MTTKGEQLKTLLDQANELGEKMDSIFKKHGMKTPELSKLPEKDQEEWHKLKTKKNKVMDKINPLILPTKKGLSL